MKILLVRNDNIGDVILTTPLFEAIKKKYPDAYLAVLCAGYSKEPLMDQPFIDKLYIYEKAKHHNGFRAKLKSWIGQLKMMLNIRAEKFDYAIGIRSSFSRSNADLVLFSGARNKAVRLPNNKKRPFGFNFFTDADIDKHEVERSYDCLAPIGVTNGGEKPLVFITQNTKEAVFSALKKLNFMLKNYIIFHITARIEPDIWSVEKWLELAKHLSSEHKILITAAPNSHEALIAKDFCKNSENINFLDTPSLKFLGYAISESKMYICVNGGAMHLGAAMGAPTLALLGDFIIHQWYPYGCKYKLLQPPSFFCEDLSVDEVYSAAKEFLVDIYN